MVGMTSEMNLVVKNTFIEFVARPMKLTRSRTFTDSALVRPEFADSSSDAENACELPSWESPRELCRRHANSDNHSDSSTAASSMNEPVDAFPMFSDADAGASLYSDSTTQAALDAGIVHEASLEACCSPMLMPTYEYPAVDASAAHFEASYFYMHGFEQGFESQSPYVAQHPYVNGMVACGVPDADAAPHNSCEIFYMYSPEVELLSSEAEEHIGYSKVAERQHLDHLLENAFNGDVCTEMQATQGDEEDTRTTVMLRNLPNSYTRSMLIELLNEEGFTGRYDFVYLPVDFSTSIGLGYAFVDLLTHADATQLMVHFEGFSRWITASDKVCSVSWSCPHQGLEQHIERYRNSPVMHSSIPEEWKPILLCGEMEVPFPQPTKQIKAPKLRIRPEIAQTATKAGAGS